MRSTGVSDHVGLDSNSISGNPVIASVVRLIRNITALILIVSVAGCGTGRKDGQLAVTAEQAGFNMSAAEYDSSCIVFFPQGTATVDDVVKTLDKYSLTVKRDGDTLYVIGAADCQFKIQLVTDPHVIEEAIEIGNGSPREDEMKACNARFEIAIENLEVALDEINTLMEVQATVQDATKGFLFLPWNGELTEPWTE